MNETIEEIQGQNKKHKETAAELKKIWEEAQAFNEEAEFETHLSALELKTMFKSTHMKLMIQIPGEKMTMTMKNAMRMTGAKVMVGKAPAGALERAIQTLI